MYTNRFEQNQFNLKLLKFDNLKLCKSINLCVNLFKVPNIVDNIILESLFLLEFFSGKKAHISHYKKNYKELNMQVANDLNQKNLTYILNIFKIFYLPILKRRNIQMEINSIITFNFNYKLSNINLIPFIPDLYFKWNKPLNLYFCFRKKENKEIILFLKFLGFFFQNKI